MTRTSQAKTLGQPEVMTWKRLHSQDVNHAQCMVGWNVTPTETWFKNKGHEVHFVQDDFDGWSAGMLAQKRAAKSSKPRTCTTQGST